MITDPFVLGVAAAFGLIVGSFLNVCIVRLPRDESVVRPRSKCPTCGAAIAWYDNVPLLSWLALRGKCRHCKAPISIQYPLVEAAVGGLWVVAAWYYGISLHAVAAGTFGTLLMGIAVTDGQHYLVPDEYTQGGLALGLLLSLRNGFGGMGEAAVGAAVGFGLLYFVAWGGEKMFGEEAMGGGDIKMMAMVGSFVNWKGVLLTIFGGALLGTLVFVPLSLKKRRLVPFGVFLAIAAGAVFILGETVARWYMDFLRAA